MSDDGMPRVETRRAREFAAELVARARTWLPDWNPDDDKSDPGRALLEVSARLLAQVAERLDRVAEKNRRNLYAWLGLRGMAARGARLPVVFKLSDSVIANADANASVLARAPVQLQADAAGTSLVLETDADVRLVPAQVALVAAVDPASDAYYLPAAGYASLEPAPLVPSSWQVVSLAAARSALLQLDPPLGLAPGMIIEVLGSQFSITTVNADIVGLTPKIDIAGGIAAASIVTRVDVFAPFEGAARSLQAHALYFGHTDLFNIEKTARIELIAGQALASGFNWQYWGKAPGSDASDWQALAIGAPSADALVLEKQTLGTIEPRQLGGVQSRWLRAAVAGALPGGAQPLALAGLQLRVGSAAQPTRPALEGLANTNPLVLDSAFFPLGREPRQFDAFYLGCTEVFAKRRAEVTLSFAIADSSFAALSALRDGLFANQRLAGIARDAGLHLLSFDPASGAIATLPQRDALQPPAPGAAGRAALDKEPVWRVPIWSDSPFSMLVAVVAGRTVWIWREIIGFLPFFPIQSSWISPSGPPVVQAASSTAKIDALVQVPDGAAGSLYALFGGALYSRAALSAAAWTPIALTPAAPKLTMLAPIAAGAGTLHLVGVDNQGALFAVHDDGQLDTLLPAGSAAADVQPIALRRPSDGHLVVIVANPARTALTAVDHTTATTKVTLPLKLPPPQTVLGFDFDDASEGGSVVFSAAGNGVSRAIWWSPDYAPGAVQSESFDALIAAAAGVLSGVPLRLPHHVLVPGARATVFELPLLAAGSAGFAPVQLWAQLPPLTMPLVIGDSVSVARDGIIGLAAIDEAPVIVGGARHFPLKLASTPANLPTNMLGFRTSQPTLGAKIETQHATKTDVLLDGATDLDHATQILVTVGTTPTLFDVLSITLGAGPSGETRAVIRPKLPGIALAAVAYVASVDLSVGSSTATVIRFDKALAGAPTSSPPDLAVLLLAFSGALPLRRRADVLTRLPDGRPAAALLESSWAAPPTANAAKEFAYSVEAEPGNWTRTLGASDSNPELSWEYSNGRSWWQLQNLSDATNRLKTSGNVQFDVPDDIIASDWAGRTNFWIRARLIGGDYGREVFTVTATTNGTVTTQSVTRSTEGVRPPVVVSLEVKYRMHDAVYPDQLLAEDAGTLRNQSDANRTPGATVEAFVPLAVELARLVAGTVAGSAAAAPCCNTPASPCVNGTSEVRAAAVATTPVGGPALLIGIQGAAEGAPVQLLLAVGAEHDFDACAPLKVEALVAGRFEPVVAQDATRAIGESGIVTMAIAHAPSVTELFGRSLSWLRLSPTNATDWKPNLAGVWLNAAWVEAAQTQTHEVLGSAQGAPAMVVTLARPPLLHDTLELRVNEALGDEEVAALRATDASTVLTEVDGLAGQWVRWSAVDDVADAAAGERVYMLDEASGDVSFGDGLNGMIPPIGRDNIVAFKYRRTEPLKSTEPDAPPPQIAIAAIAKLGLVTPLEGVEAAIAALDSDAGAPADDAPRVLRFAPARLRHRGRALSAADLEALALQAMPAIAQARCISGGAALRLVVVMRGRRIVPARAVQRELERLLLAALPAGFGVAGSGLALVIAPPGARALRVRAELRVASLDVAGAVAEAAKQALQRHLDPATGGDDGLGWPLGASPDARDLAATLIDTPALDGIETLTLLEITASGGQAPWPATLNADELAVLADDGLDFSYRLVGATS